VEGQVLMGDMVKASNNGFSPMMLRRLRTVCQPSDEAAMYARYFFPEEEIPKMLEIDKTTIMVLSRQGQFPSKEGPKGARMYDIRKVARRLWDLQAEPKTKADTALKLARIRKVDEEPRLKMGFYVKKAGAENRMVNLLRAVRNAILYAIKNSAVQVLGFTNAIDAEKILRREYKSAIKTLEEQAENKEWMDEDYEEKDD